MSEPTNTLEIDTDALEWSDSQVSVHAERRTRLLFYVLSLLMTGGIFILIGWMVVAEMTHSHPL